MPHVGKGALTGPHLSQDDAKGIDVSRLCQLALYEQFCSMAAGVRQHMERQQVGLTASWSDLRARRLAEA